MSESKNKITMEKNIKIHNSKIQVFSALILFKKCPRTPEYGPKFHYLDLKKMGRPRLCSPRT